jgi:hypothetical protein
MLQEAAEGDRGDRGDNYFSGDVSYRPDYSGRGMYGRKCVAITGGKDDCMRIIGMVICQLRTDLKMVQLGSSHAEQDQYFAELVDLLLGFAEDSMGFDRILYWPRLEPLDVDDENLEITLHDSLEDD